MLGFSEERRLKRDEQKDSFREPLLPPTKKRKSAAFAWGSSSSSSMGARQRDNLPHLSFDSTHLTTRTTVAHFRSDNGQVFTRKQEFAKCKIYLQGLL